ncbi:MAG: iron-regulated protein [Rhizobacter sp.]|nr:iron-regulated protein [Chlorobiales bacterium]
MNHIPNINFRALLLRQTVFMLFIALIASGCKTSPSGPSDEDKKREAVQTYASIVSAGYEDSYSKALELRTALQTFVAVPSAAAQTAAKTAWLAARIPYGQTEAFRFYGGPIDGDGGPEGQINSWPMDEQYIDYVDNGGTISNTGLINNTSVAISAAAIAASNQQSSETDVSTGYHAIEFLLWGQDLTAPSANQSGQRAYTDYLTTGGTNQNQARRGQYLLAAADLLVQDLQILVDAWKPNAANYRAQFTGGNPDAALAQIFTGMGSLTKGELAGERMSVALTSGDQEDEHSCFSDNTREDAVQNATGARNIWLGRYTRTDGTLVSGRSLESLVTEKSGTAASDLTAKLDAALTKVKALQSPFDLEISSGNSAGNQRVQDGVNALRSAGDAMSEAARVLGLSINLE